MKPFSVVFLCLLCLCATVVRAEEEPRRVGIYPLERIGPADPSYDQLQKYLVKNLGLFPRTEAFDLATPSSCKGDDLKCLVTVGRLAAADFVVHGSVERFSDGYALRIQLIDVGRTTRREVKRIVQGGGPELTVASELAACELLATDKCEGTLSIEGAPGSRVLVSTRDVGETPLSLRLPIGRHSVRIAKGSLSTEDRIVDISYRQRAELAVGERGGRLSFTDDTFLPELLPEDLLPPPPPAPAAPTTGVIMVPAAATAEPTKAPSSAAWMGDATVASAAVGGAFVVVGAVFGLASWSAASDVNGKFEARTLRPEDKATYDSARFRASAANVSYGVGALGLAAAGVFYLLGVQGPGAGGEF